MRPRAHLPAIREMFVPDIDHTFFSVDLDRADFQIVMWEAQDEEGKDLLKSGEDIWKVEAKDMWQVSIPSEKQRHDIKQGAHATDYGGAPRAVANAIGCTIHEAEIFQHRWFSKHPGIFDWHQRVQGQLESTETPKTVWNAFGYSISFQDRVDKLLPRALAWVPQSTVGHIIDFGWVNCERNIPHLATILNQVHDELLGQYLTHLEPIVLPQLRNNLLITVPYDDPLVIPVGIKTSTSSWGEVEERDWPDAEETNELAPELSRLHETSGST